MRSPRTPSAVCSALLFAVAAAPSLRAQELQPGFARIFDDHMVLQHGEPVRVWGWGEAGAAVLLRFGEQERRGAVGDDGRWSVTLDAMPANAEGRTLSLELGGADFALEDVVVGEVWVCGGQSNMAWTVRGTRDADLEIGSADDPLLRFVRLPLEARGEPRRDYVRPEHGGAGDGWRAIDRRTVADCTAVGYYFAQRLRRRLDVPVGLVDVSWGGTLAQFWVSKARLREIPAVAPDFERYERALAEWVDGGGVEGAMQRYELALVEWERQRAAAREAGEREPRKPNSNDFENPAHKRHPGGGFDGMLAPLRGLAVRGALYFQGENNAFGDAFVAFPQTYPAVIAEWRELFDDASLPIGLIQIGGWSNRRTMTYDMNHHTNVVREVQFDTWRCTPATGLVVTFDLNSDGNIHPGHKRPVGERAARWALAEVYGQLGLDGEPLRWRGPVYASSEAAEGSIVVHFEPGTAEGLRLDKDQALGFYLAGEDRVFHPADARVVDKTSVSVSCDAVPEPVAVRYAWSNLPLGSLMNGKELPAYPFRSDDWPLAPHRSQHVYRRQGSSR